MRLTLGLVGMCSALALLFVGCGGDDDDSAASNGSSGNNGGGAGQTSKATCDENACLTCFNNGGGADCADECKGCEDDGSSSADDSSSSGGAAGSTAESSGGKEPECTMDHDCGISFQCLSCGLNDGKGWCFQTKDCKFDEDCGVGGKCGYNVESGDYRCLEAEYCQ